MHFMSQSWKKLIQQNERFTLQGINISHLAKRKIMFKMPCLGDMLVSWRVYHLESRWRNLTCLGLSWPRKLNRHLSGVAPSTFTTVHKNMHRGKIKEVSQYILVIVFVWSRVAFHLIGKKHNMSWLWTYQCWRTAAHRNTRPGLKTCFESCERQPGADNPQEANRNTWMLLLYFLFCKIVTRNYMFSMTVFFGSSFKKNKKHVWFSHHLCFLVKWSPQLLESPGWRLGSFFGRFPECRPVRTTRWNSWI